jgi:hypothetical protein
MIDSMQPSGRNPWGSMPRTLPTDAQRRQFIAADIHRGHFVHAEHHDGASDGEVVTLSGPLASYEDRLNTAYAGSRPPGAPVLLGRHGGYLAAPARAGQRMRWPGDLAPSGPAGTGAPAVDAAPGSVGGVAGPTALARSRAAALRLALTGGGVNPGAGEADLDVPAWWLEERARVQEQEPGHRPTAPLPA